eukprot:SAG22_NODE_1601_length_4025_cov_4.049159_2_plen_71_part_00
MLELCTVCVRLNKETVTVFEGANCPLSQFFLFHQICSLRRGTEEKSDTLRRIHRTHYDAARRKPQHVGAP